MHKLLGYRSYMSRNLFNLFHRNTDTYIQRFYMCVCVQRYMCVYIYLLHTKKYTFIHTQIYMQKYMCMCIYYSSVCISKTK